MDELDFAHKPDLWQDYIGCANGQVHFKFGVYQLRDVAIALYPNDPARQTWLLLKYGSN
jgi:hypothetical protein